MVKPADIEETITRISAEEREIRSMLPHENDRQNKSRLKQAADELRDTAVLLRTCAQSVRSRE